VNVHSDAVEINLPSVWYWISWLCFLGHYTMKRDASIAGKVMLGGHPKVA
jgi:hypothetical protein